MARISFHFLFFTVLCIKLSAQSFSQKKYHIPANAEYMKGEMIVKLKPAYRSAMRADGIALPSYELFASKIQTKTKPLFPNHKIAERAVNQFGEKMVDISTIYSIQFDTTISVQTAINLLWTEDAYEFVEPRFIYHSFLTPNDANPNINFNTFTLTDIRAFQAWDITTGSHNVLSGFVDTGYLFGRPDMDGNFMFKAAEFPANGIDDDGNGYVDDYRGWDMNGNDNDPTEGPANQFAHGFEVAKKYGANTNNALQGSGASYNCGHTHVKAGQGGAIPYGYEGIVYCADNGCQIINCSWGGAGYSAFGETIVNYATINKNAAVVVAAGNNYAEAVNYPAAYRRALSVAALNALGQKTPNSAWHYTIDIATPGTSGFTSFAAPIATAGTAMAYKRFHEDLGNASYTGYQAAQRIRVTTNYNIVYSGANPSYMQDKLGTGRLDMFNAVKDSLKLPSMRINADTFAITTGDGDSDIESGEIITLNLGYINWLDSALNLTVTYIPDAVCAPYITLLSPNSFAPGVVPPLGTLGNVLQFQVSPTAPADLEIGIKVVYSDPLRNYTDFEYILYLANPNFLTITNNLYDLTVSGKGEIGYYVSDDNTLGMGVKYGTMPNSAVYEGGILIGNSPTAIANNIRMVNFAQDKDITSAVLLKENMSPLSSDKEWNGEFTTTVMPITVNHNLYNYQDANNDDYIIFEYKINNTGGTPLNGIYAGIFMDWDIASNPLDPSAYAKNLCNFDANKKMIYAYQNGYNDYYGMALLNDDGFHTRAYTGSNAVFTDSAKYACIANTPTLANAAVTTQNDIMQFISAGPFDIPAGGTHTVSFALIGGNSLAALDSSRNRAIDNYYCQIRGKVPVNTPVQSLFSADIAEKDANGWTHYYKSGLTNDLVLSLKKDATAVITPSQVSGGYGGSPYFTQISAPTAPYANNPAGWYVMNRFWNVSPTVQPTSPVGVRMYYENQDFTQLQSVAPSLLAHTDMQFFKFTTASGINPNPLLGHTGAGTWDVLPLTKTINSVGDKFYATFEVNSFSGGGGGTTGDISSFPIELIVFDANLMANNEVKLTWQTAWEMNNDYFTIQRSLDGNFFENLQQVATKGNSTTLQSYQSFDKNPYTGRSYYRLKQTDIDGHFSYSPLKEIEIVENGDYNIFPNPINQTLSIRSNTALSEIEIWDMVGKKILSITPDSKLSEIDFSGLPFGTYLVVLQSEMGKITERVVYMPN